MAITENPKRSKQDAKAESFIAAAGKADAQDDELKPVMVRVRGRVLRRIDSAARHLGLTRTGFLTLAALEKADRLQSGRE